MIKISPSMLAANILDLENDIKRIDDCGIDYIHGDIMDGVFVPNISYGPAVIKALNSAFKTPMDVHLMICQPEKYIDVFVEAGADIITIHQEVENFASTLKLIHSKGIKAGASIKPATPTSALFRYLEQLDLILIMSVEPGFGGQSFMPNVIAKISELRKKGFKGIISVDGGINPETAKIVVEAGADMLVMGTALFAADNPQKIVDEIHNLKENF